MMAIFDSKHTPRATVTRDGEYFQALIEVEGLRATRDPTSEEERDGFVSLDPVTVRAKTIQRTIELAQRAVGVAQHSMGDGFGGPVGLLLAYYRTAIAVRGAFRALGEDI